MPNHYPAELERDLLIVEASASDLKDNLLEDSIYWTLRSPGHSHHVMPKGTLGGLLMRLHRLGALEDELSSEQRERLHGAAATVREALRTWVVQAEEMAVRETKARIGSWGNYLAEAERDPDRYEPEYPTQVENRVVLSFLLEYAGEAVSHETQGHVTTADSLLRTISADSPFVWDDALMPAYPRSRFWWLYVLPVER